jgi:hypothetical protein
VSVDELHPPITRTAASTPDNAAVRRREARCIESLS